MDNPKGNDPWDGGDDGHQYGEPPYMRNIGAAILVGHNVVPCPNTVKWGAWFQTANRHVGNTRINAHVWVSTVFLGLDHGFGGRPLWFETMTFRPGESGQMIGRYTTWDEAEVGHARAVEEERRGLWAYVRDHHGKLERRRVTTSELCEVIGPVYRNRRRVPFRPDTLRRHGLTGPV